MKKETNSIRLVAVLSCLAVSAITPAWSEEATYWEEVKASNSTQNFTSAGLCLRASHQEPKGVSVAVSVENCGNRTWYPYRFIAKERWHLSTERYYVISLRTRQDLCLDIDESTRTSATPLVIMAPCAINGTNFYQYWSIVPIDSEYDDDASYVLINAGASSLKKTMVMHAGPEATQVGLAHFQPGAWKPADARQNWRSPEIWCQMHQGGHVDGWVYGYTSTRLGVMPTGPWPHCVP